MLIHNRMRDTRVKRGDALYLRNEILLPPLKPKPKLTERLPLLAHAATERAYLWRRRGATLAIAALAVGMAYGVVFGHNGLTAFAHKREEARTLQQEMQELQKQNERLNEHVDRLQNDPSAIEHEAREELHYTRAGEVIYTLPETDDASAKTGASKTPESNP